MRLLLDTHVLLALLDGPVTLLGRDIEDLVSQDDHDFYYSVASLWEIAIKWRLGKLPLNMPPTLLPDAFSRLGLMELIVSARHVLAVAEPEPPTRDPFDRLLLAQSQEETMKLVTIDRALATHPLAWRPGA